jgi:hypothetical protein
MYLQERPTQPPYPAEEIRYVVKCSCPDCPDDIIPDPDGINCYCFKHYNYMDR